MSGSRHIKRKAVTSYLMPEDMERLEKAARLFSNDKGQPNKTKAIEEALKLLVKSTEGKNGK